MPNITHTKIPNRFYSVLLVQVMARMSEALMETFSGSKSERYKLGEILQATLSDLDRQLKKNVTLGESVIAKQDLFDDLFTKSYPAWFERIFMDALREEAVKLEQREYEDV